MSPTPRWRAGYSAFALTRFLVALSFALRTVSRAALGRETRSLDPLFAARHFSMIALTGLVVALAAVASFQPLAAHAQDVTQEAYLEAYLKGETEAGADRPIQAVGTSLGLVDLRSRIAAELQAGWREFAPLLRDAVSEDESFEAVAEIEPQFRALEARHLLYISRLDKAEERVSGLAGTYAARIQSQREGYVDRVSPIFDRLSDFYRVQAAPPPVSEGIDPEAWYQQAARWVRSSFYIRVASFRAGQLLEDVATRARPHLRASTLPYRERSAPARTPARPAAVVPAYEGTDIQPEVGDLSGSRTAPFSDALRLQAESLGYDAIAIFNYVRNEIRPEWYAGGVKGADGVLASGSGNDVDQASLLVALMRISSIPARFVHGVVEIPLESVQEAFATEIEEEALRALRVAGIAHEPVIRGGRISGVLIERTWVTVKVPYSNYRGTLVDASGSIWIPLDPAFKAIEAAPLSPVFTDLELDAASRVNDYLAADRAETLLDGLRDEAQIFLDQNDSELEYAEIVAPAGIVQGDTGYLPTTLPYRVDQVSFEGAALEADLLQSAQFIVYAEESLNSAVVLDETVFLPELHNRRVTISYVPATPDDHEVVRRFGGILNTPAFLIQIRPQLKVDGELVATGLNAMEMGEVHRLDVVLTSPGLEETVDKTLLSGSYHALAISHSDTVLTLDGEDDPSDTEGPAARILSQIALRYQTAWESAERELAALSGVSVVRPIPSVVFASNAVDLEFLLDQPQQLVWEGAELDVGLRLIEGVSRASNAYALSSFFRLSALEGSVLEHQRFQDDFDVSAISADRAVAIANEAGIEVVRLDQANLATELPRLAHPDDVKTIIADWVGQGLTVRAPISQIADVDWTGFAWIVQDEQSGAAGYFISGDIGGGATTAAEWAAAAIQNALSSPYSEEGNTDALAGATVLLIPGGDGQEGVVGTALDQPLSVLVIDEDGRPVVGASTTFSVVAGAGSFGSLAGPSEFTVLTGANGIAASERLFMGTDTSVNPVFVGSGTDDAQRALQTLVEVRVPRYDPETRATVEIRPDQPFSAVGMPDDVADLAVVGYFTFVSLESAHVVEVKTVDQWGNPVAHKDVTFSYLGPATLPGQTQFTGGGVSAPGATPGATSNGRTTVTRGAFASFWTGNAFSTTYDFNATADSVSSDVPLSTGGTTNAIIVFRPFGVDQATKVGNQYPGPLSFRVRKLEPIEPGNTTLGRWLDPTVLSNIQFAAQGGFGAAASGPANPPSGPVNFTLNVGTESGVYTATAEARLQFPGEAEARTNYDLGDISGPVFALDPELTAVNPSPVLLSADGRTLDGLTVDYDLNAPVGYRSRFVQVFVREEDEERLFSPGDSLEGIGQAIFPRGEPLSPTSNFTVEVVSNYGEPSEVSSGRLPLPVGRSIIRSVTQFVRGEEDVDLLNMNGCFSSSEFKFSLNEEATVTLSADTGTGSGSLLIDAVVYGPGSHTVSLSTELSQIDEGRYPYSFSAASTSRPLSEDQPGILEIVASRSAVPPVGHAMHDNVDLFDGSFQVNRVDTATEGRGPELRFQRTYSSASAQAGILGVGWSHGFNGEMKISGCNSIAIRGMRFFVEPGGGFRPSVGLNSTLRQDGEDYDLYTKDGSRWHYRRFPFDNAATRHLEFVEDPNGNVLKAAWTDRQGRDPELGLLEDAAGRKIELSYGWIGTNRRLRTLSGSDGLEVRFDYDLAGRLRQVNHQREGQAKVESYDYQVDGASFAADPIECPPEQMDCLTQAVPVYASQVDFLFRHALTQVTDVRGNTTQISYEQRPFAGGGALNDGVLTSNFVVSVARAEGGVTAFEYSDRAIRTGDLVSTVTDPLMNSTAHTLNQYGSQIIVDEPIGAESFTWSSDKIRMIERVDPNLVVTTQDYDDDGNLVSVQVGDDEPGELTFAELGDGTIKNRVASITDQNDEFTSVSHDDRGNVVAVSNPDGSESLNVYAPNGDLLRTRDERGAWTEFSYDDAGNAVSETDVLGNTQRHTYDINGLRTSTTDQRGFATYFTYDGFDRLIETTNQDGSTTSREYDANQNLTLEVDELGRETRREYDGENRLVRTILPDLSELVFTYDLAGNLIEEIDGNLNLRTHDYDANNRRIRTTGPEGSVTDYVYDAADNLIEERRPLGRLVKHRYDGSNRRSESEDALGRITSFEYDDKGRLVAQVDPLLRRTTFEYDSRDRKTFTREPLGVATESRFNLAGDEVETIDARGASTAREYDLLGRLVAEQDRVGNRTIHEYDAVGNRTRTIDARGHETRFFYDERNREIRRIDAVGNTTEQTYDLVGNVVSRTMPNGNIVLMEYDELNRLTNISDSLGQVSATEYDSNGNLVRSVDARGTETIFVYDGLDRLVETRLPETRIELRSFDAAGNLVSTTDGEGNTTTFEYDLLDQLVRVTDPLLNEVVHDYDAIGNQISTLDARLNLTQMRYDDLDRLVEVEDALNQVSSREYDTNGNLVIETDPRGISQSHEYDAEDRLLRSARSGQPLVENEYDEIGNLLFTTDANGETVGFEYDEINRRTQENRQLASITRTTYDSVGDVVEIRDPEGRWVTFEYDLRRRRIAETRGGTSPTNGTETFLFEYDPNGNRTRVQRPEGNFWIFEYDTADRLIKEIDPLLGETVYEWDRNNNQISQIDALLNETTFVYDELNRRAEILYPDSESHAFAYDANGNLSQETTPNGVVVDYTYDSLNRESLRSYPLPAVPVGVDVAEVATGYDEVGNVLSIVERFHGGVPSDRVRASTYDEFNREVEQVDSFGEQVRYTYDPNGNRTTLTDPDGLTTRYGYDELNRMISVTSTAGITNYAYDRSGRLSTVDYPNGGQVSQFHDSSGRISSIENRQNGVLVSQYVYTYDLNGNRLSQEEMNGGSAEVTEYDYDAVDRLEEVRYPDSVSAPAQTTTYVYDATFNRVGERVVSVATGTLVQDKTLVYNNRNQLLSISDPLNPGSDEVYVYDSSGNQIEHVVGATTTDFIFDARENLRSVEQSASSIAAFEYDDRGLRIVKTGSRGIERYTYDDLSVLVQSDGAGTTIAKYEYGSDRLLSIAHSSEGRAFYFQDAIGSVVNLVDEAGAIQERSIYDAWGVPRSRVDTSFNTFGFAGHEEDSETGLIYAKARYYNPSTGRFLSQDAVLGDAGNAPSLHRYLYALGNPGTFVDPDGNVPQRVFDEVDDIPDGTTYVEFGGKFHSTDVSSYPSETAHARQMRLIGAKDLDEQTAGSGALDRILDYVGGALRTTSEENDKVVEPDRSVCADFDTACQIRADRRANRENLQARGNCGPNSIILPSCESLEEFGTELENREYKEVAKRAVIFGGGLGGGRLLAEFGRFKRAAKGKFDALKSRFRRGKRDGPDGDSEGLVDRGLDATGDEIFETGANVTPRSTANEFRTIGAGGRTFVTKPEALEKIVGPLEGSRIRISGAKARELENALGLRPRSLESRNVISIVEDIQSRAPGSPVSGNSLFKGGGAGLPGGASELTIEGIPSAGGQGIRQIILEVVE